MSASPSTTPEKAAKKTYAAVASPPRSSIPAVARLSVTKKAQTVISTEPFPPLPKATTAVSPLGKVKLDVIPFKRCIGVSSDVLAHNVS